MFAKTELVRMENKQTKKPLLKLKQCAYVSLFIGMLGATRIVFLNRFLKEQICKNESDSLASTGFVGMAYLLL